MTVAVSSDRDAISRAAERHGFAELAVFGSAVAGGFNAVVESRLALIADRLAELLERD